MDGRRAVGCLVRLHDAPDRRVLSGNQILPHRLMADADRGGEAVHLLFVAQRAVEADLPGRGRCGGESALGYLHAAGRRLLSAPCADLPRRGRRGPSGCGRVRECRRNVPRGRMGGPHVLDRDQGRRDLGQGRCVCRVASAPRLQDLRLHRRRRRLSQPPVRPARAGPKPRPRIRSSSRSTRSAIRSTIPSVRSACRCRGRRASSGGRVATISPRAPGCRPMAKASTPT